MPRVLIVDDSRTVRSQVIAALTPAGFEVLEAQDGIEAMERIRSETGIGLIILDLNMPRMGGLEFLETLRASGLPRIRTVMLTIEARTDVIDKGKRAGAKGWLVKPFKPEQLVAVARRLAIADTLTATGTTFVFPGI